MLRPVITPSLFYQYAACPHWIWYDRFGDQKRKGPVPELATKLMEQGVVHEMEYVKGRAFETVATKKIDDAVAETRKLMAEGAELIYQGAIEAEEDGVIWRGRPDLLERRKGRSGLGEYFYIPVDIKSAHSVHDEHKLQLALYAVVLESMQARRPTEGAIINIDHERLDVRLDKTLVGKTRRRAAEIAKIVAGEKPPLKLSSKCKHSPWFDECIRAAEEADDIALIYNVHRATLADLRLRGINTVHDAAKMNLERLPKISHASEAGLERIKLQAQSLIDGELKWIGKPNIPEAPVRIYFDIEGDPLLDVQYLFGFWIEGMGPGKYISFLAEKPEDEASMWNAFLDWIETLPMRDVVVYHFAPYERVQLRQLSGEHGGSNALDAFVERLVDLSVVVRQSVIFPLYFYSIKNIAKSKFLDYKWRNKKAGGAQSIFWYETWLESGDRRVLQDIIDYNEDDVVATKHLHEWLKKHG